MLMSLNTPLKGQVTAMSRIEKNKLLNDITSAFDTLKGRCIRPAEGYIKYDYLIPSGFYKQMWDWDGFFIGCYLASHSKENVKYLKDWVFNFANSADSSGYVSGCINTKGPRPIFGKFAMKPFLSQGAYFASEYSSDFSWIGPIYENLKKVISYREATQYDPKYGLFYWENAVQSGADNNPALTNDENDRGAILATDINTFQLREYLSMIKIAEQLGYIDDIKLYKEKARMLRENIMHYLWFPGDHSFFNIRRGNGEAVKRISYSNFIPLIQGLLPKDDGKAMITQYLWNPFYMLSPYGLRSLSRQDPDYNNKNIIIPYSNWQGPIWINANFLYSIVLKKYDFNDEAAELGLRLAPMLLNDIKTCGSMHENYNADTGAPLAPTAEQSPGGIFTGFIGWNLLEQNIIEGSVRDQWTLLELPF
jgi:alpha,alpha-trehalase